MELTDRESVILGHLCAGHPNKMIARSLKISDATVKVHLRTVFRKIGVSNRTQAALWASRHLDPALVANCPDSLSRTEEPYEDTVGRQRRES
ncbi:response regulator transcription factor [Acidimangrovimonas pyrenivorans]|uniref:Response regulator transcription factor n=1 Tax=Acidimangrovimonas pyrenivorans TaxID=2030798 RepID=A0ABV7AHX5_9RHOB